MVIKSDDAEYLAPFMISPVEAKVASIACGRSAREDTKKDKDSRGVECQRKTDLGDSRSVLDDEDDFISTISGEEKVRSLDDRDGIPVAAKNHHHAWNNDAAPLQLSEGKFKKKTKGLLHLILPTLTKADFDIKWGSGSIVTTQTSKESYATDDDHSKSVGRLDRQFTSSVNEYPSRNELFAGRPPKSRRTIRSQERVTKREKVLNGDDGSVSVSIIRATSDDEIEIERGDVRLNRKGMNSASLADCVTENSSVVTEKRSIFGRNRSKKEGKFRQEKNNDARSLSGSSASPMASEYWKRKRHDGTFEVQSETDGAHASKKDITIEDPYSINNCKMKDVSLADCVTETSSVGTEKRGLFDRNRSRKEPISQEYTDALGVPVSSSSRVASESRQRIQHVGTFEVQRGNIDAHTLEKGVKTERPRTMNNYGMKGVSLADCVTEASSVATEKRSIFGKNSSKRGSMSPKCTNARSVPMVSASLSVSDSSQRIRNDSGFDVHNETSDKDQVGSLTSIYDYEKKKTSVADYLTENSSVVTRSRGLFRRNRLKNDTIQQEDANTPPSQLASESLQQEQKQSNVVKKPEVDIAGNLAVEPKLVISIDTRGDVPEYLCPDNRLENVSSDITFSSVPAFAQDMIRNSPNPVTRAPDLRCSQKSMPISPVSEALQFARSQAGTLKSKLDEEVACQDGRNKASLVPAREHETGPSTYHSKKGPMACGINDVMSIIDPEWENCEEFGKGKRNYQQAESGYKVADVVQSLRAHFTCDSFGDIMKPVDSVRNDRHQETRQRVPIGSPEVTADETVSALRSLRRQLSSGTADYIVNASQSEQTRRHTMQNASACVDTEGPSGDDARLSGQHALVNAHLKTQSREERASVKSERISDPSQKGCEVPMLSGSSGISNTSIGMTKRGNTTSASNTTTGRKKSNNDDESQMMSSFFSGDTPITNNHAKDAMKGANNFTVNKPAQPATGETRRSRFPTVMLRQKKRTENNAGVISEERVQFNRLIEETVQEGEEEDEQLEEVRDYEGEADEDDEEKGEEQSIFTAAPRKSRGNQIPAFNGTKKLRDVQLVLSASSTLELPKHKRNSVIRFATVPGDISYQQATDTGLHKEQVELERKKSQKQLKLAKRAVISGQYMDNLDPCFRVFDPALDACDKFCTNSPSDDSDDECSIASASVCENINEPSVGMRQRAQNYILEPPVWPCSGRPRRVQAPCRLI